MKNKMREALENPSEPNNIKRTTDDPAVFEQKQLDDFVSSDTKVFFLFFASSAASLNLMQKIGNSEIFEST